MEEVRKVLVAVWECLLAIFEHWALLLCMYATTKVGVLYKAVGGKQLAPDFALVFFASDNKFN